MTLAVRPSITPEKNVDMIVTVLLSDLTGDSINGQPVRRVMESTTNMIVQDGQTLMLGGILFQTDTKIERKIPLLGDLPLVGGLFRHNDVIKANNELIVFITPYVIDDSAEMPADTAAQIEEPKEKLDDDSGRTEPDVRGTGREPEEITVLREPSLTPWERSRPLHVISESENPSGHSMGANLSTQSNRRRPPGTGGS